MDDEEDLHRYGTPLAPLAKDEVPVKKPVTVEDQIVKDENGRRRFHGAFTGGFSAGFWNTVGSLDGWSPQSFKSSREERAEQRTQQRPEDFMDQEDLGEFGIAPQGIRTREEFSKDESTGSRKRKLMQPSDGPIPGVPVLEQLFKPVGDKVAVRILKSMGWKPGQGVGPRQTQKEKKQSRVRNKREEYLKLRYGCGEKDGLRMSNNNSNSNGEENSGSDEDTDEEITFAPDDFEQIFFTVKDNRFGMSYKGLSRASVLSKNSDVASTSQHVNLFGPLEVMDKNKKLSIKGQAFGVGVFEQEDEDIYARDDLSRYDFSLAGDGKPKEKKVKHVQERNVIEGFSEDKANIIYNEPFTIDLPRDFKPRNWALRKSRFEPMDQTRLLELEAKNEYKKAGLGRHDLDPDKRAQLLGEEVHKTEEKVSEEKVAEEKLEVADKKEIKNNNAKDRAKQLLDRINATTNNFTSGGLITEKGEEKLTKITEVANSEMSSEVQSDNAKLLEKAAAKTKHLESCIPSGGFKPFINDGAKQKRYEQFIASNLQVESEILKFLNERQPVTLSNWDREKEMKEFIQARNIYKPLGGSMSDRFITETVVEEPEKNEVMPVPVVKKKAVLKRSKRTWKPSAILCKRYNIAEPYGGTLPDSEKSIKKKSKLSVFNYLEASVNTKDNFKTPVILPKHVDAESKPKPAESINAAAFSEKVIDSPKQNEITPATTANAATSRPKVEVNTKKFIPRTELEKQVEESRNKPISEKVDLFKLIFDNNDYKDVPLLAPKIKRPVTKDDFLVEFCLQMNLPQPSKLKGAAAENVLRNNSPPRGIFAALSKPLEKIVKPEERKIPSKPKIPYKTRAERSQIEEGLKTCAISPIGDGLYGPKPPGTVNPSPVMMEESEIIKKLQQLRKQHITSFDHKKDEKSHKKDQWIEKQVDTTDSESDSSVSSSSDSSSDDDPKHHKRKKLSKKSKKKKFTSGKVKKDKKKKSKKKLKKGHDKETSLLLSSSHHKSHKKKSKH